MARIKLSEHFYLYEFTRSQTATRHGIANVPNETCLDNIVALCENVLEKVRKYFNFPVSISSGYRCKKLNRKVKGSSSSQHKYGEAADFSVNGKNLKDVFNWMAFGEVPVDNESQCLEPQSAVEFDQIIYEFGSWIHVSYKKNGKNKRQIFRADKVKKWGVTGKKLRTVYTEVRSPIL